MSHRFRWVGRAIVTAAIVLVPQAIPANAFAIENGEPADQVTAQFVARLTVDRNVLPGGEEICTGSLVAPRLVLTAAHCVSSLRPSDWKVTFGYGTAEAQDVGVSRVAKFSDSAGAVDGGAGGGFASSVDDLAVLTLAEAVPDRQPVRFDRGTSTVAGATGAWVVEFGYGVTRDDTRQVPLPGSPKTKHFADTTKRAGQLFIGADPAFAKAANSRLDPPALLVTADPGYDKANSVTSGRCRKGDSGGPLIIDTGSGPVLLGVLSIVDGKERDGGRWVCQYTRVDNGDPYRTWLDAVITAEGGQ